MLDGSDGSFKVSFTDPNNTNELKLKTSVNVFLEMSIIKPFRGCKDHYIKQEKFVVHLLTTKFYLNAIKIIYIDVIFLIGL